MFFGCITPILLSDFFVQELGKSFCESVSKGLQHDLIVVVVSGFEFFDMWFDAFYGHDEGSYMILFAGFFRCNKITERHIGLSGSLLDLLTDGFQFYFGFVCVTCLYG